MSEPTSIRTRRLIFQVAIIAIGLLLGGRLVVMQLLRGDHYRKISHENRMRVVPEPAMRGTIVDRADAGLAGHRPSFVISVIPHEIRRHPTVLQNLAANLSTEYSDMRQKVRAGSALPHWPVVLRRDVEFRSLCYFEERIQEYPGVLFQTVAARRYTPGSWTGSLLGYTREVTARELRSDPDSDLRPGNQVGATGIEKVYDRQLRGIDGLSYLEVSALGHVVGPMPGTTDKSAVPGAMTRLTIDRNLQNLADSLLGEYGSGAAIAIEPSTGEVLCFVSHPGFSANLFSGRIPSDAWNRLLADSLRPLLNRGIKGLYPPGSVAKLWVAGAALEEGVLTERMTLTPCYGGLQIGNRYFRCHKPSGHGELAIVDAIAQSCDTYFYQVGLKLGIDTWADYTRHCGFGTETGIDLPGEDPGLVPDSEYYDRRYGKRGWTKTLAANLAIGQGELLTTPLQIAQFISGLANDGTVMKPHLLRGYRMPERDWKLVKPEVSFMLPFSDGTLRLIQDGAIAVVADEDGTARSQANPYFTLAGKTGTAQNPHGNEHAWFVAYAPVEDPLISVAVLVENAGHGSVAAAPLARKLIEKYFQEYYPQIMPPPPAEETEPPLATESAPADASTQ